jgi:hypothetical protein
MPTNVERARRGYEATLAGDLETVRGFLAPDDAIGGATSSPRLVEEDRFRTSAA